MRRAKLKMCVVLLAVALLFGQVAPAWATKISEEEPPGIEAFSIYDSEIRSLEMKGGYLYTTNTSGGVDKSYLATLGPDEESFSLVVTPSEIDYPPKLELFLDGGATAFDTLTPGEPSQLITVGVGETRKVLLCSTAQKPLTNGTTKVTTYEIKVHRTNIQFQWKLGETFSVAGGGTVQPVTLNAPAELEMEVLSLALGFDPKKLQLCGKTGVISTDFYDVLEAVPGFYYSSSDRKGYFEELAPLTDNDTGRFAVQFGKNTASAQPFYRVSAENTDILTLYFRVLDPAFTADTLYILQDEKRSPSAGISVKESSKLVSQCPNMIKVVGLPEPVVPPAEPAPVVPGDILGGEPEISTDKKTATYTDNDGNRAVLRADDVSKLTEGAEITLEAIPAEGQRFLHWHVSTLPTGANRFSVEGDSTKLTANPLTATVQTGVSYTAVFGAAEEAKTAPELGLLEPISPVERRLVCTADRSFGLQEGKYSYDLYLLPDEKEARLTLATDRTVTAVSVMGAGGSTLALKDIDPPGEGIQSRFWKEADDQPLTVTLGEDMLSGLVTIILTKGEDITATYTVTLHRVAAAPAVTISAKDGNVVATVENAEFRTVSLSLKLTGMETVTEDALAAGIDTSLAAVGLVRSNKEPGKLWSNGLLQLAFEPINPGEVKTGSFEIKLFAGEMNQVSVYDVDKDNLIGDARFGTLYGTTRIAGTVSLTGVVTGYDRNALPTVTFDSEGEGEPPIQATVTARSGGVPMYGRQEFEFKVVLDGAQTYTMTVTKPNHTDLTITGVLLRTGVSLRNPLVLYAGDFDNDNRVTVFDADTLSSGLGASGCDLDGDGKTTVFDLDILTSKENYGGAGNTLDWSTTQKEVE